MPDTEMCADAYDRTASTDNGRVATNAARIVGRKFLLHLGNHALLLVECIASHGCGHDDIGGNSTGCAAVLPRRIDGSERARIPEICCVDVRIYCSGSYYEDTLQHRTGCILQERHLQPAAAAVAVMTEPCEFSEWACNGEPWNVGHRMIGSGR